jgi:hypothetical protein
MDQNDTPLLDALAAIERHPLSGFGAPGHSQGGTIPGDLKRLLGRRVFRADVLTPKGLDDRTEGKLALYVDVSYTSISVSRTMLIAISGVRHARR